MMPITTSALLALALSGVGYVHALTIPLVIALEAQVPIDLVKARLNESATHSWEVGTHTEALIEYDWPALSVFANQTLPPKKFPAGFATSNVSEIVARVVAARPKEQKQFFSETTVGDSASIGVADILAEWTAKNATAKAMYGAAADDQLNFLLSGAPRSPEGAISQRGDQVQLWADFISMAPPFIAYAGVRSANKTTLLESYHQIKLYRDALRDESGLWKHIVQGNNATWDFSHWATGNGWAAYGMLRVLNTFNHSSFGPVLKAEQADLVSWTQEIIDGVWAYQQANGTLLNHIDEIASNTFVDSSGTALLAAATFRLASFTYHRSSATAAPSKNIQAAIKARELVLASIDPDGWLINVVDPLDWHSAGQKSPEGQAFVILLEAAHRDWQSLTTGIKPPA